MQDAHDNTNDTDASDQCELKEPFHNAEDKPQGLFSLSAELRNRIYEEVLEPAPESWTYLHDDFRQPALLCVNRQIRSEARRMWYDKNEFLVTIRRCDARLLCKVNRLLPEAKLIGSRPPECDRITFEWDGVCDWANLMWWCREVQRGNLRRLPDDKMRLGEYLCVVESALAVAHLHVDGSWSKCKEILTTLRYAYSKIDLAWRNGGKWIEMEDGIGSDGEVKSVSEA
jgi:hypothetical protein